MSQIKSKQQRTEYVRDAAPVLPPRSQRLTTPRQPATGATEDTSTDTDGKETSAQPRRRMPREESVIFKGLTLRYVDLRTSKVLGQLTSVRWWAKVRSST